MLTDARRRGAERILSLGDVGGDGCLALLHQADAEPVLGNYEVSGWRRLGPEYRAWVRDWPPLLDTGDFWAVHAVPWWPEGLQTTSDFDEWMAGGGHPWRALFPYMDDGEATLWRALAVIEEAGKGLLFHGHTHQQSIWQWEPSGRLRQVSAHRVGARTVQIGAGHRYVVGVGSVGLPDDACWAAYTLYDSQSSWIDLVRLSAYPL